MKKSTDENTESTNPAKPSPSAPDTNATKKSKEVFETEYVHIPDIPAQMTERVEVINEDVTATERSELDPTETITETDGTSVSVPVQTSPVETEIEFLYRLIKIQEESGFISPITKIIVQRIKSLS